ncbi:MAG: type II toxin-antitoxin system VapC family toxin, partial [Phycisphaerae bacterium]
MRPALYIETTIPSYLTARPSRDIVFHAAQQITRDWWDTRRFEYDLYVSQVVLEESADGDPDAARRRLAAIDAIPHLPVTPACADLAKVLSEAIRIPERAFADALHISIATVHRVPYLLTWNCAHLANATLRPLIES